MRKKIILTGGGTLKQQPSLAEMQALLMGAEKALRRSLPYVDEQDLDNDSIFVGEWLAEIADFNKRNG